MSELIECPICSERYNRTIKMPKILSCGHSFCKECLIKSLKYSPELLCSICRQKQNVIDPEQLITNRTIYDLLYNTTNLDQLNNTASSISSSDVSEPEISFKIILIGPAFSGKTCLVKRYIFKKFSEDYQVTVGLDFQSKTIKMNGKVFKMQIWDTAGTEIFQSLTTSYYRNSAGAIVVFDVGNKESFESLDTWIDFYRESNSTKEDLIYLVGNKIDINNRVISKEKAENYKNSKGLTNYFEASAKRGDNVEYLFNCIAQDIMKVHSKLFNEEKKGKKEKKKQIILTGNNSKKEKKKCNGGCC